jgi:hypothetical protein
MSHESIGPRRNSVAFLTFELDFWLLPDYSEILFAENRIHVSLRRKAGRHLEPFGTVDAMAADGSL